MKCIILLILGIITFTHADQSQLLKDFSKGYNQYSANVYKELLKTNKDNLLVCPLSVEILLALLNSAGAKGSTATEISTALHLPETPEKINEIFTAIKPHLQGNDKYELSSANKVYLQDGFEISGNFKDTAVNVFGAELQNVNFAKNVEAADVINKWVENKTHDKIKDLVSKDLLDEYTVSVLVNAIYFHGKWLHPFAESITSKKAFYVDASHNVDVDMMHAVFHCDYHENEDAKFIRLPYQGDEVSLHVILPKQKDGLAGLEGKLQNILEVPEYKVEKVRIELPKFKIETFINFGPILEQLGIKKAFSDKEADFGGIAANKQRLKIDKAIQKTYIEVKEEGTTAAAGSAVIVAVPFSAPVNPVLPKEFIADHPFLFLLRLNKLGINLFVGVHKQPTKVD